jgi:hypothetical protein
MRDRRWVHLAPSVTPLEPRASCVTVATRTSRGAACSSARTSRLVCRRRYSHIEGRRLLVGLEVLPPRGPGDVAACPHKGTAVVRPLNWGAVVADLGTVATAATNRGSTAARYRATAVVARAVANESGWGVKS